MPAHNRLPKCTTASTQHNCKGSHADNVISLDTATARRRRRRCGLVLIGRGALTVLIGVRARAVRTLLATPVFGAAMPSPTPPQDVRSPPLIGICTTLWSPKRTSALEGRCAEKSRRSVGACSSPKQRVVLFQIDEMIGGPDTVGTLCFVCG